MNSQSPEEETFRAAALAFVADLEASTGGAMTYAQVSEFRFEGQQVHLMTAPGLRGIMKPSAFETAISIRTPFVDDVTKAPYEDEIGADFYLDTSGKVRILINGTTRPFAGLANGGSPSFGFEG